MTTKTFNEETIGSVPWVKSLSNDALEAVKAVIQDIKNSAGWFEDESFKLETDIEALDTTTHREKLYRVGIAIGIRPEKVNKTVGYLVNDN